MNLHSRSRASSADHVDLPRLYAMDGDVKGGDSIKCDMYFLEMPEVITL